jgi:hypothetical protein
MIKEERIRIDARLKEEGYYFNGDYLKVQVDKVDHQVDLIVKLKSETPELSRFNIN